MMNARTTRLLSLFENLGLSLDQIAAEESIPEAEVKAVLYQHSRQYRDSVDKEKSREDISDEEFQALLYTYKEIAMHAEDDSVREKALRFLINEKKGRNDADKHRPITVNVAMINDRLEAARSAIAAVGAKELVVVND